ncbi:hypothetical protein CXF67_15605 [Psychroflexus sp. MES1-P1E]|nr:hypothetical protein CXF67_15605 [Psychroflexus sp. MES1-P1E]
MFGLLQPSTVAFVSLLLILYGVHYIKKTFSKFVEQDSVWPSFSSRMTERYPVYNHPDEVAAVVFQLSLHLFGGGALLVCY